MLQRTILRSSRSISTRIPQRTTAIRSSQFITPAFSSTRAGIASRWYSDAASSAQAKPAEGEAAKSEAAPAADGAAAEVEKLKKELEAKNKEIINLKDSYLRSVADYRNLQDRTSRDKQQAHDFALQKFARDLIPSVDNVAHALNSVPAERIATASESPAQIHSDLTNLHQGVQMLETVLLDVLKKHGLEKYDPARDGDKFDPNVHDAVFMAPQPGKEDGIVFHTQMPGYRLNGRVLRAAQVGVVKNS